MKRPTRRELETEQIVLRQFDSRTGAELHPYVKVEFMQDRLDIRPGDLVSVLVRVKSSAALAKRRKGG